MSFIKCCCFTLKFRQNKTACNFCNILRTFFAVNFAFVFVLHYILSCMRYVEPWNMVSEF